MRHVRASATPVSVRLQCAAAFDLDAAADGQPRRPAFTINAYNGGAMRPAGFYRPVVLDLSGLRVPERIPVLLDHDPAAIVGQSTTVQVANAQITVRGLVTGDDEPARKVLTHAKNGFVWAASVGVGIERLESVAENQTAKVNGREFQGPLYVVRAGRLGEVSFVGAGADETASARIAAQAAKETVMTFEAWLAAKGFDPATLSDEQKQVLKAAFDAEQVTTANAGAGNNGAGAAPPASANAASRPESLDTILARARERQERQTRIVELTARYVREHPTALDVIEAMSRTALEQDWDTQRFELEALRELRPRVDARAPVRTPRGPELSADVIESALCLNGKLQGVERFYAEPVLLAAQRRWPRGLGLGELLLLFAHENGYHGYSTADVRGLLEAAFAERPPAVVQAGGLSTLSLSGILSNVANKFLQQGFNGVETAWRQVAAVRSVNDFKAITGYSLTGDFEYEKVAPGGELKHAKVGEASYTNKADTYGRMFGIDRRDIINDDLGALTAVPFKLGRGGALKLNRLFWTTFLANSAFFAAGNGNYKAGAATALSLAALEDAAVTFRKLTDPDGNPMAISPRILLVPADLEIRAMRLMQSLEVRELQDSTATGAAAKGYGTTNVLAGRYRTVASTYLSNANLPGYSDKAWYLLADPADMPVIEVVFLNGKELPTVESADADFKELGIRMRGYHDFGVALQEPRGGTKYKGEA